MSKRLLTAGALIVGAGLVAAPMVALAQDDGDGWLDDALEELIDEGTLTQAQADAVQDAIEEARPAGPLGPFGRGEHHHGPGGRGHRIGHVRLEAIAETIGIDLDALADALGDGQTIAEVAEANGVDPQTVIDALVAAAQERFDELVADGRLDEAEVAERLADATERITELVEEGFELHGRGLDVPARDDDTNETPDSAPTTTTG